MPTTLTNPVLRKEYDELFASCIIAEEKRPEVESVINRLMQGKQRYEGLCGPLKMPWYTVAVIHQLECSGRFDCHLHNGDPLTAFTKNVPKNRPDKGQPPFTWEASATDALNFDGLAKWEDWSLPGILYKLENYNGTGYRKHGIHTPYLWSYSNHYTAGKYVKDGIWSATAVSKQVGAAVILRRMKEKGLIDFGTNQSPPADIISDDVSVKYNPTIYNKAAEELQKFLNSQGATLQVDGKAGKLTSDAFKRLSGFYLKGDPRETD
jgi:lysozyme family protein